jgi:hypothetical protein
MTETRRGIFGQLLGGLAVALGVKAAASVKSESIGWFHTHPVKVTGLSQAITTAAPREYSWTAYGYRADGSYGSYKVKA